MNMRSRLGVLATCIAMQSAFGAGPTGEGFWLHEATATNLTLTLSALTNRFTPRDPVMVCLSLKNNGATPVSYLTRTPLVNFSFDVRNSRGEPVRMTHYQERDTKDFWEYPSGAGRDIAPNEEVKFLIRFNAVFDLSLPGRYQVQASRRLVTDVPKRLDSTNCLRSNILSFDMDTTEEAVPLYYINPDDKVGPPYLENKK